MQHDGRYWNNHWLRSHARNRSLDPRAAVRDVWTEEDIPRVLLHLHPATNTRRARAEHRLPHNGTEHCWLLW